MLLETVMKKLSWFFLLALLAGVVSGCAATTTFQVQVNGYTDSAAPVLFTPGSSFFVIENQEAKNPLLEKEIKAKIDKLLTTQGYSLAPSDQADYHLMFSYGMGTPQTVSVTTPSFGFGVGMGYGRWGPGPYGGYGLYWPGYPYYTETQPLYDRWLQVKVAEGKHYRATGKFNPIWVGEARSSGTSSDLREVLNPLLIATFTQFGKNTGKAVPSAIKQDDPRFRELEAVR